MKKITTDAQFERLVIQSLNREMNDDHLTDKERRRIVRLAKKFWLFEPTGDLTDDFLYVIF